MAFLTEEPPNNASATPVAAGISRLVANNPGPMTYHGTNTYIVAAGAGCIVIDPGPSLAEHVDAILHATQGRVDRIVLTHRHLDHAGAAPELKAATGASLLAYPSAQPNSLQIDEELRQGDQVGEFEVFHTPGHAADHICLVRKADGVIFSGDHVMTWCSTMISAPNGNMMQYMDSLRLLLDLPLTALLPGHGPPMPDPIPYINDLIRRRTGRERSIKRLLQEGSLETKEIVERLYPNRNAAPAHAVERNLLSHLEKLSADGQVCKTMDGKWAVAQP
jgi:glyoxylase-like metal-dependent hydrolase (beta-lactamase superfamily II)